MGNKGYNVTLTPEALIGREELLNNLVERHSPQVANQVALRIKDALQMLRTHPLIWPMAQTKSLKTVHKATLNK
jgi:plasmid stabilization system protein ParE